MKRSKKKRKAKSRSKAGGRLLLWQKSMRAILSAADGVGRSVDESEDAAFEGLLAGVAKGLVDDPDGYKVVLDMLTAYSCEAEKRSNIAIKEAGALMYAASYLQNALTESMRSSGKLTLCGRTWEMKLLSIEPRIVITDEKALKEAHEDLTEEIRGQRILPYKLKEAVAKGVQLAGVLVEPQFTLQATVIKRGTDAAGE